jgi:type IV secretion system protein VirB11
MDEALRRLAHGLRQDLGPTVSAYLDNATCEDIVLNSDGRLWVKQLGAPWTVVGMLEYGDALRIAGGLARLKGAAINSDNPVLETVLPTDGSRIEVVVPPMSRSPIFSIRTRAKQIYSLDDYVSAEILSEHHAQAIRQAILSAKTILVSGATGSGKTTFLNACLRVLAGIRPSLRVGIIEDTPELQYTGEHAEHLLAPLVTNGGPEAMLRTLQVALRLRFDRIIVGEVRDGAALTMLKAFNTGHPGGLTSIHANSANAALIRLESLVQEAVPNYKPHNLILEAIQLVVHIDRPTTSGNRKVREVCHMGLDPKGGYKLCPA